MGRLAARRLRARLRRARAPRVPRLPRHAPRPATSPWWRSTRRTASASGATTSGRSTSRSARVLADFPSARVLACTATATPIVRDEILARLGLPPDTPQMVRGFARPEPGPARGGGGRPPRAGARWSTARWPRRSAGPAGAGAPPSSTRPPGSGRKRRPSGWPGTGWRTRGLPRRARRAHAGDRPARLRGGPARGGGRDQRLRHGHRPTRRPRGHPPGAPRLDRGVLPGGRPRGPRRRAGARPAPGRRGRSRRCAARCSSAAPTAACRTRRWSSTSGGCSSS